MSNRWIRFLLAVIAIAAAAGAAYRVVQHEQRLAADLNATRAAGFKSEEALSTVDELKAALHAYVAPGQGQPFWTARARLLLDRLRTTLLDLDAAANANGGSLGDALDTSDRLAASEQRARDHVANGQALMAGDVIFTEARDQLDSLRTQIVRVRDHIAAASAGRYTQIRQEQTWLLAGGAGILVFVMLLLVVPGRTAQPQPVASSASASARADSQASDGETSPRSVPEHIASALELDALREPLGDPEHSRTVTLTALDGPVHLSARAGAELAALCHAIAAVTDSREIEHLLERAAKILDARGVIIWMSTPDRYELNPVAAWGYDERVLARIGSIQSGSDNLTAAAFRENTHRSASPAGTAAAAVAIPLPAPEGPAGVFSAELSSGILVDDSRMSAARVIAAQLGALLGTIPSDQRQDAQQAHQR